jgi:hypothetical protein
MPLLSFPPPPTILNPLQYAPDAAGYSAFILNACMEKMQKWDGDAYHGWLMEWLRSGSTGVEDLRDWLREKADREKGTALGRQCLTQGGFDQARKQADQWREKGVRLALWSTDMDALSSEADAPCPCALFCIGSADWDWPWAGVFNSRKSRTILPHTRWLAALRTALHELGDQAHDQKIGLASSQGTITYDLVSAYAKHAGIPLLQVLPQPIEITMQTYDCSPTANRFPHIILTCMTKAVKCLKKNPMVCRDKLLACLCDYYVVLEVRRGGNLSEILEGEQRRRPHPQRVLIPKAGSVETDGSVQLFNDFPKWSTPIFEKDLERPVTRLHGLNTGSRAQILGLKDIPWQEYLYHYTRACPGPWPDQSREEYLLSLLENDALSGHTALDTLACILVQREIRSSSRLIRGDQAVTSWTSRPPPEMKSMRRWNRGLMRWTFEPYGVAVKRTLLLQKGAKPVIYASEKAYQRMKPSERFRFHLHAPPRCSWKAEKEWRLPQDFCLDAISAEDGFIFAPHSSDADFLGRYLQATGRRLPIAVLAECLQERHQHS